MFIIQNVTQRNIFKKFKKLDLKKLIMMNINITYINWLNTDILPSHDEILTGFLSKM